MRTTRQNATKLCSFLWDTMYVRLGDSFSDSKVDGANMGPTWGRQDPGGPHVCPINLATWVVTQGHIIHSQVKPSYLTRFTLNYSTGQQDIWLRTQCTGLGSAGASLIFAKGKEKHMLSVICVNIVLSIVLSSIQSPAITGTKYMYCTIANWTRRNKLPWNLNKCLKIISQ